MRIIALVAVLTALFINQASAGVITTLFKQNNEHTGNMFNVTNVSAGQLNLTGAFTGNFGTDVSGLVDVWYRTGSYVGFEANSAGWTLLGTSKYTSAGSDNQTIFNVGNSLLLNSGDMVGLYIFAHERSAIKYTNGSNSYNDGSLQLDLGIGTDHVAFSGNVFSPRTWNGSITYKEVSSPEMVGLLFGSLLLLTGLRRRKS
jgi:hypothetical protein